MVPLGSGLTLILSGHVAAVGQFDLANDGSAPCRYRTASYPPGTPVGENTTWKRCICRARNAPAHESM